MSPPARRGPVARARRRVQRVLAMRRRDVLFFAAIAATVLLVTVAMLSIRNRWRQEREASARELRDQATDVARGLTDNLGALSYATEMMVIAPVHGMVSGSDEPQLQLPSFAQYVQGHLADMMLQGDSVHGVFRVDLQHDWPAPKRIEVLGAASEWKPAIVRHLTLRQARIDSLGRNVLRTRIRLGARRAEVVYGIERGAGGRPRALFGVLYSSEYWASRIVSHSVATMPLLVPSFRGVDWLRAEPIATAADGAPQRELVSQLDTLHNRILAVRLSDSSGTRTLYRTASARDDVWDSPYHKRIVHGLFSIEVAIDRTHGDRLVDATVPVGAEQWLIAGIAVLGALFIAATILELRRQHQLAEERRNFVAAVSHELRTPLAHMVLLSETMLGPVAQTQEQRNRWLHVIHRESMRLARLVDNVLLHARGEHHELPLERRWVDACDVVDEVVGHMGPAAAARGTRLCGVTPGRCSVYVDPDALRQILLNLLDNAIKYGPDGQTVTVTLSPPTLREPALSITVDDQGRGIPARDRRRIWSPFVRLEDRGGATGGSGLGLSVVRDLARRHGGRVEVQDAPGGGARLLLVLPQDDVADEAPLRLASG
ncbi:MAG: sensor histidine kinase [Gemmatirosa sp.]